MANGATVTSHIDELRELRAGIALHLGSTGKLRQLAERVARSGEVTLGTFRIDLRCPSRRLLCLRGAGRYCTGCGRSARGARLRGGFRGRRGLRLRS
jgi:hypothetical protein